MDVSDHALVCGGDRISLYHLSVSPERSSLFPANQLAFSDRDDQRVDRLVRKRAIKSGLQVCLMTDGVVSDKKAARQAAEVGIKAAERAVALKPDDAENYRVLGTLCGQAITDLMSGLTYGPRAKDAIAKAVARAPNSSMVYVARGVGNYYLPPQLGGGLEPAVADFRKAIELDSRNAEAYLWLGLSLRKENKDAEARQAFEKSLSLNPNSGWAKQQLSKTPAK